ncbi:hypothetical protein HPB47_022041, partial [Ixodes persulcatus]
METSESGVDLTGLWIFLGVAAAVFFLLVVLVLCLKAYNYCIKGVCTSPQQMDGKTVIITGGNAGIGKETAKELARHKARVILACRNINKGQEAANEIFRETQQTVVVKHLDLSSLKSVRDFARDVVSTEQRLDVLINNAGMALVDNELHLTEDGYELAFQTNYLGHFLLTMLLLGIGKETAKELARRKARVILACRNINKGQEAANEIFRETQQTVVVKHLDLSSLKSVRDFARDVVSTEQRLDVLINNAGMALVDNELHLTEDGYELAFQTNYLGHFLLTMLLLDLLKKTAPSRVVNVSSALHHFGATDRMEERIRGALRSSPTSTYNHTKMANVMFTIELAKRLKDDGVTVNALHPGVMETGLSDGLWAGIYLFESTFGYLE